MKLNATLTVFVLFFSNKGFHNNQKWKYWKVTNDINSILHITVLYITVQYSKCSNAKIKHKIHYCKYRKTGQLCVGGITDPAVCLGLATGSHQRHKRYFLLLSNGENNALCAESIHGLTLPQCLRMPLPLPVEEACGHVVGGHIRAISKRKRILEMASKGASIQLQIDHCWWTSPGQEQPGGN